MPTFGGGLNGGIGIVRDFVIHHGMRLGIGSGSGMDPARPVTSKRRTLILAGLISLAAAGAGWSAPAAFARTATSFDGNWSVLIVTDAGNCDRAYRYALRISNGLITYPDQTVAVSGHVDGGGRVRVNVSAGGQHANGSGHLSGSSGSGRWSGASSTSSCSGHWEAERRG
jgi:hypothetical protein